MTEAQRLQELLRRLVKERDGVQKQLAALNRVLGRPGIDIEQMADRIEEQDRALRDNADAIEEIRRSSIGRVPQDPSTSQPSDEWRCGRSFMAGSTATNSAAVAHVVQLLLHPDRVDAPGRHGSQTTLRLHTTPRLGSEVFEVLLPRAAQALIRRYDGQVANTRWIVHKFGADPAAFDALPPRNKIEDETRDYERMVDLLGPPDSHSAYLNLTPV